MNGSYDEWRLQDGGDYLGRGNGRMTKDGACLSCDFRGDAIATVRHQRETGHTVTYRGTIQARSEDPAR